MQVLSVIVPYIKTTSNIAISCRALRDWLVNNGFPIRTSKAKLCAESLSLYKLLKYPKLDGWTTKEFRRVIKTYDCDQLLLLLKNGANIEAKDNFGDTILIWAAREGKVECLKILLERKANIEAETNYGYTALTLAACWGEVGCLKILLEQSEYLSKRYLWMDCPDVGCQSWP